VSVSNEKAALYCIVLTNHNANYLNIVTIYLNSKYISLTQTASRLVRTDAQRSVNKFTACHDCQLFGSCMCFPKGTTQINESLSRRGSRTG
jgi:hypothetical protein